MLNKWKNWTSHWNLGKNLREAFDSFSHVFHRRGDTLDEQRIQFAFQSLIFRLLQKDGFIPRKNREILQRLSEDKFNHREAENLMESFLAITPLPLEEATAILQGEARERKQQFLELLLALAVAAGDEPESIALLENLAGQFQLDWRALSIMHRELQESEERRKRILSSGLGVLAALVVLLVFVLTAKLLLPVVFGVIFACILLPLEKFYEKRVQRKSSFSYWLSASFRLLFFPLHSISTRLRRKDRLRPRENASLRKLKKRRKQIVRATAFTSLTVILFFLLLVFGISKWTGHYVDNVRNVVNQMKKAPQNALSPGKNPSGEWAARLDNASECLKNHFESIPVVREGIGTVKKKLADPLFRQKLMADLFGGKNGVFSITAGVLSGTVSFFCNLLLTVFFTLLFLMKLAEFCGDDDSDKQKSEYLVRMFFNGVWLPDADEAVIGEARRIIEGVFFRLRVWLRGYLTLVLVDATVYTILFSLLSVPFALPLGLLAGCGIMLPYLGPVLSCGVTLVVTFAAGSGSGFMLAAILLCYLCYNGVVEQFILYPAVIGESLGLSTLETIIVVLLGAIFAGIPGMILALPVASVAKYIIPQCYRIVLQTGAWGKKQS